MPDSRPPIRVVIVDDHPLFRQGLLQAIQGDDRFQVVGEAAAGSRAIQLVRELSPDIAVLDINLPDMTGLEVARILRDGGVSTKLVFLTMLKDEKIFDRAMSLGASGFLLKESPVTDIISCLVSVTASVPYVSQALLGFLLNRHERGERLMSRVPGLGDLTVAERRILKRVAEKKSTKEIAQELNVSPRTVETHRANICAKLELKGGNSLLQFALENRDSLSSAT
jgi:DNA-binding NarL/FixJ family response regulator